VNALPADEDDPYGDSASDDADGVGGEPSDAERDEVRELPEGLWQRLRSDPAHAPQLLALAAVDRWGEQARAYAARVRQEHPEATSQQLAKMVKSRHALLARMEGAAAGVPTSVAPGPGTVLAILPDLGALAWLQSRMVVHIAAVYGHDTTDHDMAAELLVLQGFYNTTDAARIALTEASKRVAKRLVTTYITGPTLVLLKQLFRYVGIKFTKTGLLKAIPFVAIPLGAAVNEAATRSLARRAIKYYDTRPPGTA
jgi:uncharacterized protein (DUF697 family)